ncbi:hypothetical protein FIBSPDRAFT_1017149 [Athelia psychrophila]|uniref:Uncharacterized protein n=1 Tax=Athelia psychrophila TaxID=1759441 RepID=A0A167TZ08_9AGAM|nr:hypothetical protein FIBSPDRAFT_1017149 [Fibularhizoctonia sp. CBS 109695]
MVKWLVKLFGRNDFEHSGGVRSTMEYILSCCSASSTHQGFDVLENEDESGRENLMERDPLDLLCSLSPTLLNHPPLVPLPFADRVTLGGAFRVNPGWPRWVDTSLFVVCSGDVQSSCILLLSPVGICVQLGNLISHQRDFSIFQTFFVVFQDIESGAQPPCLAVPHSLNLPITRSSWSHPMSRWCRSLLKDISCFPIQVVVFEEVEEVSVYNVTVQGLPGDDDFLNSAAGRCIDSDSEDDDSMGYRSDRETFSGSYLRISRGLGQIFPSRASVGHHAGIPNFGMLLASFLAVPLLRFYFVSAVISIVGGDI